MVKVAGLDHVVLYVADIRRSVAWYTDRLGLATERFDEWTRGEAPFVSVRIDAATVIDLLEAPRTGTNVDHLCIVLADTDLAEVVDSGSFEVVEGPVERWGAQGWGTSVYVTDPDGHVLELRIYTD
jgi:catechol 2,3-dioxygenase-like lactoylglutathione lyase family enzyme